MTNKFASALSNKKKADKPSAGETTRVGVAKRGRRGSKHIGGYFDPAVSLQLRQIALDEETSMQALLAEAIDMLFESRGKPTIGAGKAS